jgi:hypothetical protein
MTANALLTREGFNGEEIPAYGYRRIVRGVGSEYRFVYIGQVRSSHHRSVLTVIKNTHIVPVDAFDFTAHTNLQTFCLIACRKQPSLHSTRSPWFFPSMGTPRQASSRPVALGCGGMSSAGVRPTIDAARHGPLLPALYRINVVVPVRGRWPTMVQFLAQYLTVDPVASNLRLVLVCFGDSHEVGRAYAQSLAAWFVEAGY